MGSAELQVVLFADCRERYFRAAKSSNKCSTILQDDRFGDVQESRFQSSKLSNMGSAVLLVA